MTPALSGTASAISAAQPSRACSDGGAGLEPGVPSHWQVFFGVPDLDAALGRVVELGGAVLQPAWDTGFGRRAMVADPTGARFLVASVPDG